VKLKKTDLSSVFPFIKTNLNPTLELLLKIVRAVYSGLLRSDLRGALHTLLLSVMNWQTFAKSASLSVFL